MRSSVLATIGGLVAAGLSLGCSADLGGGDGVEVNTGHDVGFGRVAGSTKIGKPGAPLNQRGVMLGGSLEARAEQAYGSRWDLGVLAGWGVGPAEIDGKAGFEVFAEVGTPLTSTLGQHGDYFVGGVVAVPIPLNAPREVTDLNRTTWLLMQRLEIVPMAQARAQVDDPQTSTSAVRTDLELGVAFRVRVFSDLF